MSGVENPSMLFLQVCGTVGAYSAWFTTSYYFAEGDGTTRTLRHSGRANMSFLDGHVGDITKNDAIEAQKDSNHKGSKFHMADTKSIASLKTVSDANWGPY